MYKVQKVYRKGDEKLSAKLFISFILNFVYNVAYYIVVFILSYSVLHKKAFEIQFYIIGILDIKF